MPRTGPHAAHREETTPLSLPKLNSHPRHLPPPPTEACLVISNPGLRCRSSQHLGDCSPHTTDLANTSNQDPSRLLERASLSLQDPLTPDITGLHEGAGSGGLHRQPLLASLQDRAKTTVFPLLCFLRGPLRGLPVLACNLTSLRNTPGLQMGLQCP